MSSTTANYSNRKEIPEQYKWDFSHIYPSVSDWEKAFENLKSSYTKIEDYKGKVTESADVLSEVLELDEKIGTELGKLYLYSFLNKDIDMSDPDAMTRFGKIQSLAAVVSAASSFVVPEILSADEERLDQIIRDNRLSSYSQFFDNLKRRKKHTLSSQEEEILSTLSPVLSAPYNSFSLLKSTDLDFPTVRIDDKDVKLSDGKYSSLMYSQDSSVREKVYTEYYKPYIGHKNTLASNLDAAIKSMTLTAKIRKYSSSLEASLNSNKIPVDFFKRTVSRAKEGATLLQEWAYIKAKKLGKEKISPFDTYVSLFNNSDTVYHYPDTVNDVLESLRPLGQKYVDDVKDAINNRRIDVYETPGKRSGAYSSGTTYSVVPYVLLNWNNTLNDVFTFTHELGHNMHSLYTGSSQPYIYAGYSIFLAEVASITNEALLHRHLEKKSDDRNHQLYLHELFLNKCLTTYFRQLQFADFEQEIHSYVESGQPLTPDYLSDTYGRIFKDFWGESVILRDEEKYSWTRIPHFYYNFYVYQYATGLVAGEWLAEKIANQEPNAVENYLKFLHAGKSKYPMEILKEAGADLSTDAPFDNLYAKMRESLEYIRENMD